MPKGDRMTETDTPNRVALDYDGTFSAMPEAFTAFLEAAMASGDLVCFLTMRFKNESLEHHIPPNIPVIYTGRKGKKLFCEKLGFTFDIWIDDNPHFLYQDAWDEVSGDKGKAKNRWDLPEYTQHRSTIKDINHDVVAILRSA